MKRIAYTTILLISISAYASALVDNSPVGNHSLEKKLNQIENKINYILKEYNTNRLNEIEEKLSTLSGNIETLKHSLAKKPATKEATPVAKQKKSPFDSYKIALMHYKQGKLQKSLDELTEITKQYPKDNLSGNAHYWIGEIRLKNNQLTSAVANFQEVIHNYTNHTKEPDALLKLAITYNKQKNKIQAKKALVKLRKNT